jgi:hypothetical protein
MWSCISFFDFIPVALHNRRLPSVDDSVHRTGGRYAEISLEVRPGHVVR